MTLIFHALEMKRLLQAATAMSWWKEEKRSQRSKSGAGCLIRSIVGLSSGTYLLKFMPGLLGQSPGGYSNHSGPCHHKEMSNSCWIWRPLEARSAGLC